MRVKDSHFRTILHTFYIFYQNLRGLSIVSQLNSKNGTCQRSYKCRSTLGCRVWTPLTEAPTNTCVRSCMRVHLKRVLGYKREGKGTRRKCVPYYSETAEALTRARVRLSHTCARVDYPIYVRIYASATPAHVCTSAVFQ